MLELILLQSHGHFSRTLAADHASKDHIDCLYSHYMHIMKIEHGYDVTMVTKYNILHTTASSRE